MTDPASAVSFTVLVVDDSPADRELYSLLLRGMGLHVINASDGLQGLVCARTLLPDLIITDLRMPALDGWGLMLRLRADATTAGIPVLLVTGDARELAPARVRSAGARALLAKPLDLPDFQSVVTASRPARAPVPGDAAAPLATCLGAIPA